MYDIDKEAFAGFLAQLRKEKGWTQRELAEKLFVSDKAVSKWERGLSLPDISLLIPLAEQLGVTVTELLEGRKIPDPAPMEAEDVENLVKKALRLSEENPEIERAKRRKRLWIFGGAAILGLLEYLAGVWLLGRMGLGRGGVTLLVAQAQAAGFGLYFWGFMKERLPDYYDQDKISFYSDGMFRLNLPGAAFNNENWPRIVKALRIWSLVTLLTAPVCKLALTAAFGESGWGIFWEMAVLAAYLLGLCLPVYWAARGKHQPMEKRKKVTLLALAVLIPVLWLSPWTEKSYGTLTVGYVSSGDSRAWSARYGMFSGTKVRTLRPKEENCVITVETKDGHLDVEVRDDGGVVFYQEDVQTGRYPVTLRGKCEVTVRGERHKGSFAIGKE